MFYRRKILLALLQTFGALGKTQFQKLLLLLCERQDKPDFDFLPYKYGGYSFCAAADLYAMENKSQVSIQNNLIAKLDKTDYTIQLKDKDRQLLRQLYLLHKGKTYSELIKHTYTKYPYYAINSHIAHRYLDKEQLEVVNSNKYSDLGQTILFTIGYEGVSIEAYINKLVKNGVSVLVDVRNNAMSMKYGFSKSQMVTACKYVGIEYIHFPDVGIVSEQRHNLVNQADYDLLFERYKQETLSHTLNTQEKILLILKEKKRIALTCFEANICQCHRKHLAEAITKLAGWHYDLKHIK